MDKAQTSSDPPTAFQKLSTSTLPELTVGTPIGITSNANLLADQLGVSPLYRQMDSARWTAAAQVYHSSRAQSPLPGPGTYNCPVDGPENVKSPLSLEEIANMNRRWHAENGGKNQPNDQVGPLELEAIAAVHELNQCVNSIRVSEMLPRTSDLIFLNVKTHEGQAFCLELTMKGWRIASCRNDSMQGSHLNVEFHTRYFHNAKDVLKVISPGHVDHFAENLYDRLRELQAVKEHEENELLTTKHACVT